MDQTVSLPWAVRMKIIRDIVNGMGYLHSKGVFHRDLNPKVSCRVGGGVHGFW